MDKPTDKIEVSKVFLSEIFGILEEFGYESDEDSPSGMADFEGRIAEDWFFYVKNKLEKLVKN